MLTTEIVVGIFVTVVLVIGAGLWVYSQRKAKKRKELKDAEAARQEVAHRQEMYELSAFRRHVHTGSGVTTRVLPSPPPMRRGDGTGFSSSRVETRREDTSNTDLLTTAVILDSFHSREYSTPVHTPVVTAPTPEPECNRQTNTSSWSGDSGSSWGGDSSSSSSCDSGSSSFD